MLSNTIHSNTLTVTASYFCLLRQIDWYWKAAFVRSFFLSDEHFIVCNNINLLLSFRLQRRSLYLQQQMLRVCYGVKERLVLRLCLLFVIFVCLFFELVISCYQLSLSQSRNREESLELRFQTLHNKNGVWNPVSFFFFPVCIRLYDCCSFFFISVSVLLSTCSKVILSKLIWVFFLLCLCFSTGSNLEWLRFVCLVLLLILISCAATPTVLL